MERHHIYDHTFLVRYGLQRIYPEFGLRARSTVERVPYVRGVQTRIMQAKDHLSLEDKKIASSPSYPIGQYVTGASSIALASCGAGLGYQDYLANALRDPSNFRDARKFHSGIITDLSRMTMSSHNNEPVITMTEVAEKFAKFLQFGQIVYETDTSDHSEGIQFLAQVDLATSLLWGYNGDASHKVSHAFDIPIETWMQEQLMYLTEKGIIPSENMLV